MKKYSVQAENLMTEFPNKKIGLHPCTFSIEANSMVAILGPTGCGKSTLLKTLAGIIPNSSGKIFIAGKELDANYESLKTHIGFVPQHDHDAIHFDLTVQQCLTYSARIRLPDMSIIEQDIKIMSILKRLNIHLVKDSSIRDLSGGQQKRVSIAVELLIDPMVLFLDEPTSPLDPQTIAEFLENLRELTKTGTTIIMVTHKPEDLRYMDECIFMGVGGYLVYKGSTNSVVSHFNKSNILEVYKMLNSSSVAQLAQKFFLENQVIQKSSKWTDLKFESDRNINYFSQFHYLSLRYALRKINDFKSTLITIAQAPIIAMLMVFIFPGINHIVLFFIAISAIWFGTNNAAKEIVSELPYKSYDSSIYTRERMYNLGIVPYILSKLVVLSLIGVIQSIVFIGILYFHFYNTTVPLEDFTSIFLWMSFTIVVSSLFGLVLSAFSRNNEQVMSIIPIALIPQIMISGVIVKISGILFIEPLSYFTIARWSTTGLARIQPKMQDSIMFPSGLSIDPLRTNMGSTFENSLSFSSSSIEFESYIFLIQAFFFFLLIYLKLRDRDLYRNNYIERKNKR